MHHPSGGVAALAMLHYQYNRMAVMAVFPLTVLAAHGLGWV